MTRRSGRVARAIDLAISGYQRIASPILTALGAGCKFHPTCSDYARQALGAHPLWRAAAMIAMRLLRCGPWNPGGYDPVVRTGDAS